MMMMILVTMLMTKFTWVRKWTADGKASPQCGRIVLPSLPRLRWLPLNVIFIVIIIIISIAIAIIIIVVVTVIIRNFEMPPKPKVVFYL